MRYSLKQVIITHTKISNTKNYAGGRNYKMTTFSRAQAEELMKRTSIAINNNPKLNWLSFDKRQDLASIVYTKVCNYKPTEQYPDPIPCIDYLKTVACRQARKDSNNIITTGQRIADREADEVDAIKFELNLDGEETRFNPNFKIVSYDDYHEATGWEPAYPSMETQMIEYADDSRFEAQIEAYKASPIFPAMLKAALTHVEAGGTMKSFAENMGISAQTLMNRFKNAVKEAIDNTEPFLPIAFDVEIKTKPVKQVKKPARREVQEQYSLF